MNTITLFGCGAIGSQLAMHLASPDIRFVLVDDDKIEENNLMTSAFSEAQVNVDKSLALSILLYRKCKCTSMHYNETLTDSSYYKFINHANLVTGLDLIIDCLDNAEARKITCKHTYPTLHVGVSREGTGSITWDIHYKPFDGAPRGQDTFCTHLAGRGIIRLTSVVAANIVEHFLSTGEKRSLVVTEKPSIVY